MDIPNPFKKINDTTIYRVLPRIFLEGLRKYFRLEVEGLENVPRRGAAIIAPNHSGFSGIDALLLSHILLQDRKRVSRVLTHYFWFISQKTAVPAQKMGFTEASMANGVAALKKNNVVIIFPEGESGNFKPSKSAYQLQEFKRGFIRMALLTQSPIVPVLVIGAEESSINLKELKLDWLFKGISIPLPLNLLPLPTKWKIKFLPPIYLPYKASAADDQTLVKEIAEDLQERMQTALSHEVHNRKSIF
jgi:1-acyl-sn-glycerol-3-phosphate acyltransferase